MQIFVQLNFALEATELQACDEANRLTKQCLRWLKNEKWLVWSIKADTAWIVLRLEETSPWCLAVWSQALRKLQTTMTGFMLRKGFHLSELILLRGTRNPLAMQMWKGFRGQMALWSHSGAKRCQIFIGKKFPAGFYRRQSVCPDFSSRQTGNINICKAGLDVDTFRERARLSTNGLRGVFVNIFITFPLNSHQSTTKRDYLSHFNENDTISLSRDTDDDRKLICFGQKTWLGFGEFINSSLCLTDRFMVLHARWHDPVFLANITSLWHFDRAPHSKAISFYGSSSECLKNTLSGAPVTHQMRDSRATFMAFR